LPPDQKWKQDQIEAMPTIVRLAKERKIELFQSMEMILEALKGEPLAAHIVDLFKDVPLGLVPHLRQAKTCKLRKPLPDLS
jgi:hypothetical protein